jgi:hypothetical protein
VLHTSQELEPHIKQGKPLVLEQVIHHQVQAINMGLGSNQVLGLL